jgi:hypothetical protein
VFLEERRGGWSMRTMSWLLAVVVVAGLVGFASAGNLYVPTGYGTPGYATIQAAINAANPAGGDVIHVAAGYYEETANPGWRDLYIDKSLDLIGAGSGSDPASATIVGLNATSPNGLEIYGTGVSVLVQGITFTRRTGETWATGFNVRTGEAVSSFTSLIFRDVESAYATGRNLFFDGTGSYSSITVENCNIHHSGAWGASMRGIVDVCTITNSHFDYNGTSDPAHGIGFDIDFGITFGSLTVTGGSFSHNAAKGINLVKTANATFTGITADYNSGAAFPAGGYGVSLWEWAGTSSNLTFTNSSFSHNSTDGFLFGTEGTCSIDDVNISGCRASSNGRGAVFMWMTGGQATGLHITDCDLSGNTWGVYAGLVTVDVDASGNWWGSAAPATVAGKVTSYVDYTPWLGSAYDLGGHNPGFEGDFSSLWVGTGGPQTQATGRIQEGVGLSSGSTVNVLPGTYVEVGQIVINKNVQIIGDSASNPVVKTDRDTGNSGDTKGWWLVQDGKNLTLRNLVLDGSGYKVFQGIRAYGAGTLDHCRLKNMQYNASGPDYAGTGIAFFGSTGDDNNWTLTGNSFEGIGRVGVLAFGCGITASTISGNTYLGKGFDNWLDYGIELGAGAKATVTGNTITNCLGVASSDGSTSAAVLVTTYYSTGGCITTGTFTSNQFTGNTEGVAVGYDASDFSAVTAHYNNLAGNTANGVASTAPDVNAEMNWWGDPSGPGTVGPGSGSHVTLHVDYDPWLTGNIVCVPDPQVISLADVGYKDNVVVECLGGGSGPLYGYSIDVEWNIGVVSASFARPDNGPFSTCAVFIATSVGSGHARIDAALGGATPGVSAGELFKATFTAVGTPDYATSDVDLTIRYVRDGNNVDLTGFSTDDGLVIVDLAAPAVDVAITNPAVFAVTGSHEWFKQNDALTVTATVTDGGGLASVVADLSQLGGGGAVPDPTPPYEWNQVAGGGNGDRIAYVTATDMYGNSTVGHDHIIADNILPGTVAGFAAAPGHEKVHLSWTDMSSLPDQDYYSVKVQYRPWSNYPYYSTGAPAYPANAGDGLSAFFGDAASATHTITARDIYYYSAFVCDWALNYGTVDGGGQGRSTNYWLGDVAAGWGTWGYNGVVNENDINRLGGVYGAAPVDLHSAECDVGPTYGHGRLGIPLPDAIIDFEDLMIFAMNYGIVSPAGKIIPLLPEVAGETLALSLQEGTVSPEGDVTVALRLEGNVSEVKGISTVITYDPSELEFLTARLADGMVSPLGEVFFWHGEQGSKVQVDVAVLGTDVTIGGSGEVAILTFRALTGEHALGFDGAALRGAENEDLTAELQGLASHPEMPTVFKLVQNAPNPFNPVTTVKYDVPFESDVTIQVYDVAGREVRTLVDGSVPAGRHQVVWDGRNDAGESVGSGVYFCVMDTPEYHATNKMMLLK